MLLPKCTQCCHFNYPLPQGVWFPHFSCFPHACICLFTPSSNMRLRHYFNASFYLIIMVILLRPLGNICTSWRSCVPIYICSTFGNFPKVYANLGTQKTHFPLKVTAQFACCPDTADTVSGQLWVYSQGQNCLPCHLLSLTFKMMKRRESDPWQGLFKEQPLGNGGSSAWQPAGGLISPLLKGQIQKT